MWNADGSELFSVTAQDGEFGLFANGPILWFERFFCTNTTYVLDQNGDISQFDTCMVLEISQLQENWLYEICARRNFTELLRFVSDVTRIRNQKAQEIRKKVFPIY